MKKRKIISILAFSPRQEDVRKKFRSDEEFVDYHRRDVGGIDIMRVDEKIGNVFFYHTELFHMQAQQILAQTDKYEIECWRPYIGIERTYSKEIDGIKHKLIPKYVSKNWFNRTIIDNRNFERELKIEITKGNVLFIHSFPNSLTDRAWLRLKPKDVPIYAIHRGSLMIRFVFPQLKGLQRIKKFYRHLQEKKVLKKYIDVINETVKKQADYIEKNKLAEVVTYFPDGVDFNLYKPVENMMDLRKELGLPEDKKLIMYVGRFTKVKDVDFLIDAYKELLKNRTDIQLVLIGGNIGEEFYNYGLEMGAIMVERMSQIRLAKYQQAADLYVLPTRNYVVKEFGGIGSAVIQSMACGVPVISDNLMHFEGTVAERKKLGFLLNSQEEFLRNCNYILDNPNSYTEVREVARKYYDSKVCTAKMVKDIDALFKQYYG